MKCTPGGFDLMLPFLSVLVVRIVRWCSL